jgi:hypothetical protein
LTTVNESPEETTTPLVALPAQLQTSVAALPALQPPPGSGLTTPQPPGKESPTQKGDLPNEFPTQLGNAPAIVVNDSGILPSLFEDPDNDDIAPVCAARQLCCDPNSDTKEYCFCINCNKEAHTICTEQMDFQIPALDKFVITQNDFNNMGKARFKKTLTSKCQNVVFCLLCKARMIQKKLHPTKKLSFKKKLPSSDGGTGTPPQPKKGKIIGPLAGLLRNLRKVAAYHCQMIIFNVVNKTSDKTKHTSIEKYFHGNVNENIIGA